MECTKQRATLKLVATTKENAKQGGGSSKPSRLPWTGGLTEREAKRPGAKLLSMLLQCANDRGMYQAELAREIGVTQGYISQLRNGLRNIPDVSDDFLAGCARLLGVPRIVCAIAAGKLKADDLYAEASVEDAAKQALQLIGKDGPLGALLPVSAFSAPEDVQLYIVMLFEAATGKKLIRSRVKSIAGLLEGN